MALVPVDPAAARRAARRSRTTAILYLAFGATSTALLLTAVALGESGPTRALLYCAGAVLVAWAVVGMAAMGRAYGAAGEVFAPLGLRTTSVPRKVPGAPLVGSLRLAGKRQGRAVEITQWPSRAVTRVDGRFPAATVADPVRLAAVTGEDAGAWRCVRAVAGEDGVVVERRGNGAGRHVLQDLLLAECLAGAGGDPL